MKKTFYYIFSFILILFSCKQKEKRAVSYDDFIYGKWKVIDANLMPFDHSSFCDNLTLGSIFEFKRTGEFWIYPKNHKKPCNIDKDSIYKQFYHLDSTLLTMSELDMIFDYKFHKISKDTIKLEIYRPQWISEKHHLYKSLRHLKPEEREQIPVNFDSLKIEYDNDKTVKTKPEITLIKID